jgi:hypothetical protein
MRTPPDEPLMMTVHSMPSPSAMDHRDPKMTRAGRWKMLLLVLVCVSPVIASYFTYYVIRPEGRRNYGELIVPLRPIPAELTGTTVSGETVPLTSLMHQWLFLSVADSACDAACEQHLYFQRQIREGLGRDKDRVDWVWLRTGETALSPQLQAATAQAQVLHVDEEAIAQWLQPAEGYRLSDHLFVVDPMGNWMMRFEANADPSRMRRDLGRLLRASSFWDRPGR